MEAAQGRSQAAACGVSGCASTVECSAYGFMRVRTSVRAAQQHRATKAQTICLKLLKRYALSWTWFKPGRRLRLVVGHLESGSLRGLRCAVHRPRVRPPPARCGRRVFCASSMTVCE